MKSLLSFAALLLFASPLFAQQPGQVLGKGLVNPESVCVGSNGKTYVTAIGEFDKDGDGAIMVLENGKLVPFVTGLDDPKGITSFRQWLYVADKQRVLRIDTGSKGAVKVDLLAPPNAFPTEPLFLNDITADPESGMLYVSDSGDRKGGGGAVYRITPNGLVSTVVDTKLLPGLNTPNGVLLDGASHLLLADFGTGFLYRIKLANGASEKIAEGLGASDGLAFDRFGHLFISDYKGGQLFVIPRPGDKPILVAKGFGAAADICIDPTDKNILVPDMKLGTLSAVPITLPGAEVDVSPLPIKTAIAFPNLQWTGWKPETDAGKPNPLRPIVLTHAGDGSNRIFVATEHGVIHGFPNDQNATQTKILLDIQDRVKYDDKQNEEGFLGLAFHPKFKETGELFVFYTPTSEKGVNIVSRFRMKKGSTDEADPASEEILLKYNKPFWNHDGGTICFGPDGYLYVFHGDGGAGNDPHDNGQNLGNLLGKILRIDINAKSEGLPYAIPKDNPFVGVKDARGEIYAYGFRNVWRMSFDRKTGQLWAADVGQNLYEEIDVVQKGGNYGWNRREALHPFGARGTGPSKDLIDPIWEYHHEVGKSVTGGTVYRGKRLPELDGYYLYGDYVTTKMWGLKYDEKAGRVVANRPIADPSKPILSYGEDETGEVYFLTTTINGKGIYWFTKE